MIIRTTQALKTSFILTLMVFSSPTIAFDPHEALKQSKESNDGTVVVGRTQWMRCSLGQQWDGNTCTGDASRHNWEDANALPGLMNAQGGFASYTDWRLPSIDELASIRQCSAGSTTETVTLPSGQRTFRKCTEDSARPAIDSRDFPNDDGSIVWSSTPDTSDSSLAWIVNIGVGYTDSFFRSYEQRVRLVRTLQ